MFAKVTKAGFLAIASMLYAKATLAAGDIFGVIEDGKSRFVSIFQDRTILIAVAVIVGAIAAWRCRENPGLAVGIVIAIGIIFLILDSVLGLS